MPRGILKNGVIYPLEPLPAEWSEGQELHVEALDLPRLSPEELERIDQWFGRVEEAASQIDEEDDRRLTEAIAKIRRQAKEQARWEMGLVE